EHGRSEDRDQSPHVSLSPRSLRSSMDRTTCLNYVPEHSPVRLAGSLSGQTSRASLPSRCASRRCAVLRLSARFRGRHAVPRRAFWHAPRGGPAMKIAAAIAALVVVGALEARESAQQIADATGPLRPSPSGIGLTALGLIASVAIYVVLGWSLDDRAAVGRGALVGVIAGTIGGAVRASIIAG